MASGNQICRSGNFIVSQATDNQPAIGNVFPEFAGASARRWQIPVGICRKTEGVAAPQRSILEV